MRIEGFWVLFMEPFVPNIRFNECVEILVDGLGLSMAVGWHVCGYGHQKLCCTGSRSDSGSK